MGDIKKYQILLTGEGTPPSAVVTLTDAELKTLLANIQSHSLRQYGDAWLRPDEIRAIFPYTPEAY